MPQVAIHGDGVAGCCCAVLLDAAGISAAIERADHARVPALMVGEPTQALIADALGKSGLFDGLTRIERRIVKWGRDAESRILPHSAAVISEQELAARLRGLPANTGAAAPVWTILASRPIPATSIEHHFGSRVATASAVALRQSADSAACWIESLEDGWLFLVPSKPGHAWLLSVGAPSLLEKSRLIAGQIDDVTASGGEFPAHPRIVDPICGENWLACGSAAIGFDPVCGDGTGNAVREAILAAAVVRAVSAGEDRGEVLRHYRARLIAGFHRHLELCREFYASGHDGPWWQRELRHLDRGIEWCRAQLAAHPGFQYRLDGFELKAVASGNLK